MAKPRSPRGRHSPMLATRVSAAEKKWFDERAAELGKNPATLQRDRLLFDMPEYAHRDNRRCNNVGCMRCWPRD